jgi:AcrR family transcriptional regulator
MSLEGVAEAAGVSKPALYRRWSSKADLATAALENRIEHEAAPRAEATTEEALRELLRRLRERLLAPNSMALVGTLLAEERRTPELITLFRERVWERRAQTMRVVLERARERGEIRDDADVEAALDLLIGSLYSRYIRGAGIPRAWTDRVVSAVLRGITKDRSTRAPRRRSRS